MKDNNYAFIDSQNLNLGIKSQGWSLDYGKFRLFLRNKYQVQKAYLFIGYIKENASLYAHLQSMGYILVFKNVMEIKKGEKKTYKGNVDAELVLHTMLQKGNFDKCVIVSGDGDFFCLVEQLVLEDKLLKLIVPNAKYSSLLKSFANHIYQLHLSKKKLKLV